MCGKGDKRDATAAGIAQVECAAALGEVVKEGTWFSTYKEGEVEL